MNLETALCAAVALIGGIEWSVELHHLVVDELGLDSLDLVEVAIRLEEVVSDPAAEIDGTEFGQLCNTVPYLRVSDLASYLHQTPFASFFPLQN